MSCKSSPHASAWKAMNEAMSSISNAQTQSTMTEILLAQSTSLAACGSASVAAERATLSFSEAWSQVTITTRLRGRWSRLRRKR